MQGVRRIFGKRYVGLRRFSNAVKENFEVLDHPAPGNPFHLAIPVHNMKAGELLSWFL